MNDEVFDKIEFDDDGEGKQFWTHSDPRNRVLLSPPYEGGLGRVFKLLIMNQISRRSP